jgi:hypothetical protein
MLDALSRWLYRRNRLDPGCLEREAQERRELERRVDRQLAKLIAALDELTINQNNNHREVS